MYNSQWNVHIKCGFLKIMEIIMVYSAVENKQKILKLLKNNI